MKIPLMPLVGGSLALLYAYILIKTHGMHVSNIEIHPSLFFVLLMYSSLYDRFFVVLISFSVYIFLIHIFDLKISFYWGYGILMISYIFSLAFFKSSTSHGQD
jgi:hypothetical protein